MPFLVVLPPRRGELAVLVNENDAARARLVRLTQFVVSGQIRGAFHHALEQSDLMTQQTKIGDSEFLAALLPDP